MRSQRRDASDPFLCRCGSGKPLSECCGLGELSAELHDRMRELDQRPEWNRLYGQIRPSVTSVWRGRRMVAVGRKLVPCDVDATFLDFLFEYIKTVLRPDWGNAELQKPFGDRHVVMQWYDSVCAWQRRVGFGQGEVVTAIPNGAAAAYFLLAYDLYLLEHHDVLDAQLVDKLRLVDSFQGARHELFAATTAVRAGLKPRFENERDGTQRHPEFTAVCSRTGQALAVEAKSRKRAGILGASASLGSDQSAAGITRILNRATAKISSTPIVLFLDVNLPPHAGQLLDLPWVREVLDDLVKKADRSYGGKDPFNLVIVSNFPHHYGEDLGEAPATHICGLFAKDPVIPIEKEGVLMDICIAAMTVGRIPQTFSSN